jgi:peptide chain release factor 3
MPRPAVVDESIFDADALGREVERRRTFAIISHPDAGKTTLTEKLLLYAGAIDLAGAVRGRKTRRHATSDWMDIERQRGISISAAALEFEVRGRHVTLLDTPGHEDFSEDTYRTLLAVDSVVMVVDAAKGVEAQTRKLFEVCRARRIPVLTFVNKLDQPSRDPFALLDEIERVLGIAAAPMNWPIGDGPEFRGVYDFARRCVLLYERQGGGRRTPPVAVARPGDAAVRDLVGRDRQRALEEAASLVAGAGTIFDPGAYREARQTPVFFGSALHDFGVEPFLDALLELAPAPAPRAVEGGVVDPADGDFSGFVFKVQANMNPRHRDRVAFFRICSGRLTKDMLVSHRRLGTTLRLARVYRFFGRDRETVPEAFAGDVVGLVQPGQLAIGDTLYAGRPVSFPPIPQFSPERFATIRPADAGHKRFGSALQQLAEEGLLQLFVPRTGPRNQIIGVVGALQFDVIDARLASEYGIRCVIAPLPYVAVRWPVAATAALDALKVPYSGAATALDRHHREVLLFESEWSLKLCLESNPDLAFLESH